MTLLSPVPWLAAPHLTMNRIPDSPATFTSTVDHERKQLRTEVVGRIDLSVVEGYIARKANDGTLSYGDLLDARRAHTAVSAHDIQHVAGIVQRLSQGTPMGPVAIVVADNVTYGMTRMMAALIEGTLSIQPFHDVEKAEEWLNTLAQA